MNTYLLICPKDAYNAAEKYGSNEKIAKFLGIKYETLRTVLYYNHRIKDDVKREHALSLAREITKGKYHHKIKKLEK